MMRSFRNIKDTISNWYLRSTGGEDPQLNISPKDALLVVHVRPICNSCEDVRSSMRKACASMLFGRSIESCLFSIRQLIEQLAIVLSSPVIS